MRWAVGNEKKINIREAKWLPKGVIGALEHLQIGMNQRKLLS